MRKIALLTVAAALAAGSVSAEPAPGGVRYGDFLAPARAVRPWTYWFLTNTLTDRETITEEFADIAALGFGGMLVTDSRGYWVDDEHLLVPEATIRWGSDAWLDLFAHAIREAAKNGLKFSLNIAASGGHLRGDVAVGGDSPKFLMCRNYLPGEPFEAPEIPNYRDVAVFAVRTKDAVVISNWRNAGDGYYSMSASSGKRADGEEDAAVREALEVRELKKPEEGAGLGAGWTVIRFGAGTRKGQEVDIDVLDREAVNRHLDRVIGRLIARVPELVGRDKTFANLYNVSWEGAMPTWSATFERDFRASEGYEVRPLLPMLAGFRMKDKPLDAFMRDFRHARGVMMRNHLYGAVREWAHKRGMGAFSESGGPWQRNPQTFGECDQLAFLGANDFPQGEYWPMSENGTVPDSGHANANGRFLSQAIASAAHVYDRRIASAEAFTHMHRHWSVDPAFLKPLGDQAFADGINLIVWHTYTSSPKRYGVPGIEYFAGSHINRNVTWHGEFAPMVTYLGRCQALLQAGEPVTDVAVLVGDRAYSGWGWSDRLGFRASNGRLRNRVSEEWALTVPKGYAHDMVNDEALAKNPKLLSRYRIVHDARKAGGRTGTVATGTLKPDVETFSDWTWIHRRIGGDEAYFVAGEGRAELIFRAAAKSVEIWNPVTGGRKIAEASALADGRTRVALELPVGGSAFVMFLREGGAPKTERTATVFAPVEGPWKVSFAYHPGITAKPPEPIALERLVDFTRRPDLRHFAGKAVYRTLLRAPGAKGRATLSLGEVPSGLAHVYVNGKDCGAVWCAPWEAEIGFALHPGENTLEIHYINNWHNRLVGDCALPEKDRVTRSNLHYWNVPRKGKGWKILPTVYSGPTSSDRLQPSGLLGPVEVRWAAYDGIVRDHPWQGRTVAFLGDSITDPQHIGTTRNYWQDLAEWLGITYASFGQNGQQWPAVRHQAELARAHFGDKLDALIILMGSNDYNAGVPLGAWYDEGVKETSSNGKKMLLRHRDLNLDPATFRGRINGQMKFLKENFPEQQIVLLTPVRRGYATFGPTNVQPDENYANRIGHYIDEYAQAVKEAGEVWAVPVIDLGALCGIIPNLPAHTPFISNAVRDRLHPSAIGHERIARALYAQLLALPPHFKY